MVFYSCCSHGSKPWQHVQGIGCMCPGKGGGGVWPSAYEGLSVESSMWIDRTKHTTHALTHT